jgi:hypothetical protein
VADRCKHEAFTSAVAIHRIEDLGRFMADVKVACAECGEPFRFLGLEAGLHFTRPAVSITGLELHVPIEPQGEPRLQPAASFSMPAPAAFAVRNAEIEPLLRELGDRIGGRLPEGWGFALFLVSYGEEGELFYISSAEREGMATALRGWLARQVQ